MKKRIGYLSLAIIAFILACMPVAVTAAQTDWLPACILDEANLLNQEEFSSLNALAASLSDKASCGIYVVVVPDYRTYSHKGVFDAASTIYESAGLGFGENADGVLLVLSMENREYALIFHGFADIALTEYARDLIEDAFLDDFHTDDWRGGFLDYLSTTSYLLERARNGNPVEEYAEANGDETTDDSYGNIVYEHRRRGPGVGTAFTLVFAMPCMVASLVCINLKERMRTVRPANSAANYMINCSLHLTESKDEYTHTTYERIRIEHREERRRQDEQREHGEYHRNEEYSGRSGKF